MLSRPRRNYAPAFKVKVTIAAIKGEKPPADYHVAMRLRRTGIDGASTAAGDRAART